MSLPGLVALARHRDDAAPEWRWAWEGLLGAYVPALSHLPVGMVGVPTVTPGKEAAAWLSNGVYRQDSTAGVGLQCYLTAEGKALLNAAKRCTVLTHITTRGSVSGDNTYIGSLVYDALGGSPYMLGALYVDTSQIGNAAWANTFGNFQGPYSATGLSPVPHRPYVGAVVVDATEGRTYAGGQLLRTDAIAGGGPSSFPTSATTYLGWGNDASSSTRSLAFEGHALAAWYRAMSDREVARISADPVAMFRWRRRRTYFVQSGVALLAIQTDAQALDDATLRLAAYRRQQADTVELAEATYRMLAARRTAVDALPLTEQTARRVGFRRGQDDAVELTEQTAAFRGLTRLYADAVALTETVAARLGVIRRHLDAVALTETTRVRLALRRLVSEAMMLTEATARRLGVLRRQQEAADLTETPLRRLGFRRGQDEAVQLTDTWRAVRGLLRLWDDAVALAETTVARLGFVRLHAEVVALTETVRSLLGRLRVRTEVVELAEAPRRVVLFRRAQAETVTASDTATRLMVMIRARADGLPLTDGHLRRLVMIRRQGETIELAEATGWIRGLVVIASDQVRLVEGVLGFTAVAVLGYLVGVVRMMPSLAARLGLRPTPDGGISLRPPGEPE